MNCPSCGEESADSRYCPRCGTDFKQAASMATAPPPRKAYKVMTQKDCWFGGKFDPDQLEKV